MTGEDGSNGPVRTSTRSSRPGPQVRHDTMSASEGRYGPRLLSLSCQREDTLDLVEDVPQMPLDGAMVKEEAIADLSIGKPLLDRFGDLQLLTSEPYRGSVEVFASASPCRRRQLAAEPTRRKAPIPIWFNAVRAIAS